MAELIIYALSRLSRFKDIFEKRNIGVYPFIIFWKRPSAKRLSGVGRGIRLLINAYAFIGIAVLIYSMFIFYNLVINFGLVEIIRKVAVGNVTQVKSPLVPVVPGVTIPFREFIYIGLGIAIGVVVHELGHALVLLHEGIRLTGWGFGVFIIFPFAFVEPAEDEFKKSRLISKLKVLSSGVLNNAILAVLLAMLIMPPLATSLAGYSVVTITSTMPGSPADRAGIPTPSIILTINDTSVKDIDELRSYLMPYVNKSVTFNMTLILPNGSIGNYLIRKLSNESLLGIYITQDVKELINAGGRYIVKDPPQLPLFRLAFWTYIVNYSLAIINAAPLIVTDGAQYINELLKKFLGEDRGGKVSNAIQIFTVALTIILLIIGLLRRV